MKKLLSILLASTFLCSMTVVFAAPADNAPPAQQQKNQVPDTHQNGDYLEPQPDNNNAAPLVTAIRRVGRVVVINSPSRATLKKAKRFHEKPQDGGTGVKQ